MAHSHGVAFTYGDVHAVAGQLAGFLKAKGVSPQQKVCIYAHNRPEWPMAFWGIVLCGAVVVPIDPNSGAAEISHVLRDTGAQWIFTESSLARNLDGAYRRKLILIDGDAGKGPGPCSLSSIIAGRKGKPPALEMAPDSPAMIIYTSGTTSQPKGVILSSRSILAGLHGMCELLPLSHRDRFLSTITLSHTFEILSGLVMPYMVGASVIYAEDLKYTTIFRSMREFQPTVMLGVPLVFKMLLENAIRKVTGIRAQSLRETSAFGPVPGAIRSRAHRMFGGAVRFLVSGGAPLAPSITEGYRELGIPLLQVYGLTETSGPATLTPPAGFPAGSAGMALPGVDIRIHHPNEGGIGEICIRGPHLMTGYHNNVEATREVVRDGWLHTGDLGCIDRQGNLFITGRSKNVIVTAAGVNVYPEEIEQRLIKSPFIREACVVGKQRPDRTETVCAAVVVDRAFLQSFVRAQRKQGKEPPALAEIIWREIQARTADLARFKRVHGLQIRSRKLPRGRTNKVLVGQVQRELAVLAEAAYGGYG